MNCTRRSRIHLHLWESILVLVALAVQSSGLNTDGILLLSFKLSILNDPLSALSNWNSYDQTPCYWNGVTCDGGASDSRVTALSLPSYQLLGSIPSDLGMIQHLQILDLSNNSINSTLPVSLFNATEIRVVDLSNNLIAGDLPETIGRLQSLQVLNLSDNALAGKLPASLTTIQNLTAVSLKNNYFSGQLPGGFRSVQFLDLSSNLINGSLPSDFGGGSIRFLNVSYNRLFGSISPEFAAEIPRNATVDLSFNNLTGEVPVASVFTNQESDSFSGNSHLCGEIVKQPCPIPSPPSSPNVSGPTSPPALAAIPDTFGSSPEKNSSTGGQQQEQPSRLKPAAIVGIVVGDVALVGILAVIFFIVYKLRKKRGVETTLKQEAKTAKDDWPLSSSSSSSSSSESRGFSRWSCLRKKGEEEDEESETSVKSQENQRPESEQNKKGTLVTVDGTKELELETLLKASAYILGATGSSIMYRAVLEDGTALAVRRIGECGVDRFREFESQVRFISKLVHPNLVRIRGFYWGLDEKLVIYDFVPNGSLANARYRKVGSSPCHLPWEARLKIAKGVARGLAYLHEKRHVHANLKPSNILLGTDMEPKIGDFGLERLLTGDMSYKGGSARNFGSNRSTASRESLVDFAFGPSPSPSPSSMGVSPYFAPESLRSLKPNPKWDVFSFGVILLELLSGKVIIVDELGQGNGLTVEDKNRALRMADVVIRADLEGKEDALLACFKLGFSCASPIPQKRPSMKDALQVLDKFPSASSYYYGH